MSATSSKLVEVGVILQGGGALGAYECGALNALLGLMDEFAAEGRRIVLKIVAGIIKPTAGRVDVGRIQVGLDRDCLPCGRAGFAGHRRLRR